MPTRGLVEPMGMGERGSLPKPCISKLPPAYSEVPNTRADRNKRAGLEKSATLLAYLLSK